MNVETNFSFKIRWNFILPEGKCSTAILIQVEKCAKTKNAFITP